MPDDNSQGADPTQAFQNRLNKMNGDAMAFATQLFDENYQYRTKIRGLEEQLTQIQAKAPAEGSVVLSREEAALFEAYKVLGKPEDVKKQLDENPTVVEENKKLKRRDILREVADVGIGGSKLRFSVLEDRANASNGIEFLVKEEGREKDKRKVAYVKDGDKETPLEQYAQKNWADYMPSLKAEQAKRTTGSANGGDGANQPAKFDMNTQIRQMAGRA